MRLHTPRTRLLHSRLYPFVVDQLRHHGAEHAPPVGALAAKLRVACHCASRSATAPGAARGGGRADAPLTGLTGEWEGGRRACLWRRFVALTRKQSELEPRRAQYVTPMSVTLSRILVLRPVSCRRKEQRSASAE